MLDLFDGVDMGALRARSIRLSERFVAEVEARSPELEAASPRAPARRGSQVSFRFAESDAAMQALIDRRVIGDFRAPDLMRFGFAPALCRRGGGGGAARRLEAALRDGLWRAGAYRSRTAVA